MIKIRKDRYMLEVNEILDRAQECATENLCFISKDPLSDDTIYVGHPEAGHVEINSEWL